MESEIFTSVKEDINNLQKVYTYDSYNKNFIIPSGHLGLILFMTGMVISLRSNFVTGSWGEFYINDEPSISYKIRHSLVSISISY